MNAVKHNLTQGSSEWSDFRSHHFGASDASAMLGLSLYKSRDELLREKATGISPEVNEATQRLFDEGHRLEKEARLITEALIGEGLYQPTMSMDYDGLPLSCSCDGLTLMEDILWECKTLNSKLKDSLPRSIPVSYHPQLEQMMLITGADKAMFMAYDGETNLYCWYKSNPNLRKQIIAGWKQFNEDLKAWKPVEIIEEATAETIDQLPALNVQIEGGVTRSNLNAYKTTALKFIAAINTDLQTDQDFADADAMVKFCGKTEKELDAVKTAALNQTADIADLFSTIDTLKAEMRSKRLELDKLVKSRKQQVKSEIVMTARNAFGAHLAKLDTRLHNAVRMPDVETNFGVVVKNKRTITSLQNAINTELARCKIEANEVFDRIDTNIQVLHETAPDHRFLFNDLQDTCTKANDDFTAMVKLRVSAHEELAMRKLEEDRERIRKEEQAKAEAKAAAKAEAAERERVAREEERAHMLKQDAERKLKERTADVEHDAEQAATAPRWYTCETCGNRVNDGDTCPCSKPATPDLDDLEFCDMSEEKDTSGKPDCDYFMRELNKLKRDLDSYTKDELRRTFIRLYEAV